MRKLFVALALILSAASALGNDQVTVRFQSGYPHPDFSSESVDLVVKRNGSTDGQPTEVDKYFAEIGKILKIGKVPSQWGFVQIDGPSVSISISLNGRTYELSGSPDRGGIAMPVKPVEKDKQAAMAIQAILKLTLDRTNARFALK